MKTITREIAHVGMFGPDGVRIAKAHLSDCAQTFDGKGPVTLGHKLADWMPKFGNIARVELQKGGESLVGKIELNDVLADAVDSKFYDDLSIGIQKRKTDGKHYIHHLAFLGAIPPKIRDLKVFTDLGVIYCGDEEGVSEYAAAPVLLTPAQPAPQPAAIVSPIIPAPVASTQVPKEEDVELKEENEKLKKDLADSQAVIIASAKDGLKKAMDGRVPKAKQGMALELADRLDPSTTIELADENGAKEKVSGLEILRRVLESIPKAVTEGRTDLGDEDAQQKPLDLKGIMAKV